MKKREEKLVKLLPVLVPLLGLAAWYGHSTMQGVKAKEARRRARAKQQVKAAEKRKESGVLKPPSAAGASTTASPSPPPGATPADNRAAVPPAAPHSRIQVDANLAEQARRAKLPWGRDPFVPPDTHGPRIRTPGDIEGPRDGETMTVTVDISDAPAGNSGVKTARLLYATPGGAPQAVAGRPPDTATGDGAWTFEVPAPTEQPLACFVVAQDRGRLENPSKSKSFRITPPPRDAVSTDAQGVPVKLVLRGISYAEAGGVALINQDVVTTGEQIHGYKVVRIDRTAVVLVRGDQEITLELKE
ncbi:MAG: hypothetical protein ACOC8E_03195 [Planctomycetota bacterium]